MEIRLAGSVGRGMSPMQLITDLTIVDSCALWLTTEFPVRSMATQIDVVCSKLVICSIAKMVLVSGWEHVGVGNQISSITFAVGLRSEIGNAQRKILVSLRDGDDNRRLLNLRNSTSCDGLFKESCQVFTLVPRCFGGYCHVLLGSRQVP